MTPAERARLAALAAAATPGPWRADDQDHRTEVVSVNGAVVADLRDHTQGDDAALIAASRTAVPELLAALDDAEAERDRLRKRVKLAEAWLEADDERVLRHSKFCAWPSSEAASRAREAFRASKGGE